jgi:integrase
VAIRRLWYTKEEFTPHGFRAMFATVANREGDFNLEIIDAQLSHKVGGTVSQAYNRSDYIKKRKDLVQWWADWLDKL